MSFLELVLAFVALAVGAPSIRWNPTAAALVVSWAFGYAMFWGFGHQLTTYEMVYCDWAVIAWVMAKPEVCNFRPYTGFWHWLYCRLLERSIWDRAVLLLFIPAWIAYFAPISEHNRWGALFWIVLAQFAAAGGEAYIKWRDRRTANAVAAPPGNPSPGAEYRLVRETWSYG